MFDNKSADLYAKKKRWKIALSIVAVVIVILSMYYTNNLVKKFALQEQRQMGMWAEAVQTHAELMNYTEIFFNEVSNQENKRVELLAMAYRRFLAATSNENIGVYLDIIRSNISIPVVITDSDNNITLSINLHKKHQNKTVFDAEMEEDFSIYPPIKIDIYGKESGVKLPAKPIFAPFFIGRTPSFLSNKYSMICSPSSSTTSPTMQRACLSSS